MSDRASDITSTSVDVTSTQRSLRLDGHAVWTRLEPLPGQRRDDAFACVTRGLPMPPEGLAYVVRLIGDGGDGGAREVRVVGYVDRHARAFEADGPLGMAPAQAPDVVIKRFTGTNRGCVELSGAGFAASDDAPTAEAAAGDDAPEAAPAAEGTADRTPAPVAREAAAAASESRRVADVTFAANGDATFSNTRVNLGANARALPMPEAAALAFVAFSLLPRQQHVSLQMMSVADVMRVLTSSDDLFAVVDQVLGAIGRAARHPLLNPPGILLYLAHLLRAAGMEGATPVDVADPNARPILPPGISIASPFGLISADALNTVEGGPQLPEVYLVRTVDYADMFYVAFRADLVSARGRRMLLETESAINRFLLMARTLERRGALETATQAQCAELDRWLVDDVLHQLDDRPADGDAAVERVEGAAGTVAAAPGTGELAAGTPGTTGAAAADRLDGDDDTAAQDTDLEIRIAFAQACEALVLPYRLEYRFRLGETSDHLYVDASTPAATLMPCDAYDPETHAWGALSQEDVQAAESRYAAHVALLLGLTGLRVSTRLAAVTVNVWRDARAGDRQDAVSADEQVCALSVAFDRERMARLLRAHEAFDDAASGASGAIAWCAREPFEAVRAFPHAYVMDARYRLGEVHPLADLDEVMQAHKAVPPVAAAEVADACDAVEASGEADAPAEAADAPTTTTATPADAPAEAADGVFQLLGDALTLPAGFAGAAGGHAPFVSASVEEDDDATPPVIRINPMELDERPFDDDGRRLLVARRVRDMGIFEDVPRREIARRVTDVYWNHGVAAAVAALRDEHDRTESPLVRAACDRVSDALVSDRITRANADEIDATFSDAYGLRRDARRLNDLAKSDPGAAYELLNAMIARVDDAGWFADTDTHVYRYFDSYATRALYAGRCADDRAGRDLRLVADEYFLAHHRLAALLSNSVSQAEEAIAHARRCVELAPSAATAYLRLARCYFAAFDYVSEIQTLKDMLRIAWNPTDVGMALYWMGYALWMTGQKRVGIACYQRCTSYDQNLAEPASAELTGFLAKEDAPDPTPLPEDEVDELLRGAGIDLDLCVANAAFLVRASDAALRAGSSELGVNLLGSAAVLLRDDALATVIESLSA